MQWGGRRRSKKVGVVKGGEKKEKRKELVEALEDYIRYREN